MIEFDVEARRSKPSADQGSKTRYLLLGDFGGRTADPLMVDRDNIDNVLTRLQVNLAGLQIREVEDFHPDRLYKKLDSFQDLAEEPEQPPKPPEAQPRADLQEILKKGSLLEQIAEGGDPFQRYLRDLARAYAAPAKRDDRARVQTLGERMRDVLHHPRFQTIEAAWRGLDFAVRNADEDSCRIHIAQYSREDLRNDLAAAKDLRSTRAFQLFTAREWGGVFGLYSFGSSAEDIEILGRIALLAAHIRRPFVAEGSVDMGDHWEELRSIPEAKYLALALPRLILRLPYGAKSSVVESFPFEEMAGKPEHVHYLWGNPSLAVLAVAARGGIESDDLDLESLPVHTYQEDGEWKMTPCAEAWLRETQVQALMDMGMIPLVSFRDSDRVRVAGVRAINGSALNLA